MDFCRSGAGSLWRLELYVSAAQQPIQRGRPPPQHSSHQDDMKHLEWARNQTINLHLSLGVGVDPSDSWKFHR